MDYVPQEYHRQITEALTRYHRLRENVEEICEINRELLRRREALWGIAMRHPRPLLSTVLDTQMGGLFLANWLQSEPAFLFTGEVANEPQDHRAAPTQTGVRIASVQAAERVGHPRWRGERLRLAT